MALKYSMILQAVDRMSGPAKRAQAGVRKLTQGARDLARSGGPAATAMERVSRVVGRMPGRLKAAAVKASQFAGRAGLKAVEKAAYGAGYAIGFTIRKASQLALTLAKVAAGGAALALGASIGGVIATTAKFEQFQIMLEGTEGSAEKAKKSMAWVQNFSEKTPYQLEEVMRAYVQLKAYGIDPMEGSLRIAGDAASAMGKDLMSAVEAIADAQMGEMERLKELGITTKRSSGQIAMTYVKNGKTITKSVKENASDMRDGVLQIWDELFGGGMARQAKSFDGVMNNLKDKWTGFLLKIGQAGIFDKVKDMLVRLLAKLDEWAANGKLDEWAKSVSDWLVRMLENAEDFIDKIDWEQAQENFRKIADSAVVLADAIVKAVLWGQKLSGIASSINPFTGGLAGAGIRYLMDDEPPGTAPTAPRKPPRPASADQWRRGMNNGSTSPLKLRTSAVAPSGRPQQVAVGGEMTIRVEAAPGTRATPGKLASANANVPLRAAYLGGAMMGRG